MPDEQISPGTMARVDQVRAKLRNLVEAARRHLDTCPRHPAGVCIGAVAGAEIDHLDCGEAATLLEEAVAQLAQVPAETGP